MRTALQPAGDEAEHPGARPVQPLQVVDDDQERPTSGGGVQQRQSGGRHHEPVGGRLGVQAEGTQQGVPVPHGQRRHLVVQREEQLMERREAHLGLELHSGRSQQPDARGGRGPAASARRTLLPTPGSPVTRKAPP